MHRVVLLYSGGLDTSVMLKWIQDEYDAEVVALCVDLGQPADDFDAVRQKALDLGAVASLVVDAKEEFARDYVAPAIKANARYQGGYPLFTALGRPLLAKLACEAAREHDADTVAHGCTGKGNDQVRIEATIATLAPDLKVIAPVREWSMGRDEEIAYAQEHGIPVTSTVERPYSIDDNLWGRSSEGGVIEDLEQPPPGDVFQLVTPPTEAPDRPEDVVLGFRDGLPVSLDGEELGLVELIRRVADAAARNGVGILDHIEDRVVGLKVRDLYEVPAAEVILTAHRELEKLVCTGRENALKPQLDALWAQLAYEGVWYEPLLADLNAFMDRVNARVEGEITMRLYKGSATAVARRSPNAIYDRSLATFNADASFAQGAAPGFIELFSLQSRTAYRIAQARERG
ncbi:argininosuccinate synthase [Miltoncostaea marina]|uniref:argininosuccinate synthase n=1 Tax=Miltoncostaea marina TaxID=2843215 RepID=UPI001C3D8BBD|nr:argininosuccinate synthase [Miltoncostaea marina]